MKRLALIAVSAFVTLFILSGCTLLAIAGVVSDEGKKDAAKEAEKTENTSTGDPTLGDTITGERASVKFCDFAQNNGKTYSKASKGKVFVHFLFEVTNNTDENISFSSFWNADAYCDDYSLSYSFNAEVSSPFSDDEGGTTVAPGKKTRASVSYEVPEDWEEIEIVLDQDFWSAKGKEMRFVITNPESN